VTDTTTVEVDDATSLALSAARARRRLLEAPGLVAYIRTLVVPGLGGAKDGMPRAASKEPPAPMRIEAADDSDSLYAQLVNWVDYWAERLSVNPPATLLAVWRNKSDVQGFRGTVTPPGAGQLVGYLTTWLLIRHDEIAAHEFGRAYFDDVSTIIRSARRRTSRTSCSAASTAATRSPPPSTWRRKRRPDTWSSPCARNGTHGTGRVCSRSTTSTATTQLRTSHKTRPAWRRTAQ
jgi:hypothetical protein